MTVIRSWNFAKAWLLRELRGLVSRESLARIETIYNDALTLQPGERAAFLDRVCSDDSDLRREVDRCRLCTAS